MLCLKVLTFVFVLFTTLGSFISLLTNYWIEHSTTHHQGLYYFCNDEDIGCQKFDEDPDIYRQEVPDWHLTVLGLMIITCILHLVAVFLLLFVCIFKRITACQTILIIVLVVAWIALTTALSLYTRKFYDIIDFPGYSWGYSFILGWLSFCFNIFAIICAVAYSMMQKNEYKKY